MFLFCNLNCKEKYEYDAHIGNVKEARNHGLKLEKVYRMIKFNQKHLLIQTLSLGNIRKMFLKNIFSI